MRHLRSVIAFVAIALLAVACSSPSASQPTDSNGGGGGEGSSEPSSGGGEATATPDGGGGGGGGGGANGSITYQITGDYEASGELPFIALGLSLWDETQGGWVANFVQPSGEGPYILLNTATLGSGQILSFGDGTVLVVAISDPNSGYDCTFTLDKNDTSGLKGSMECSNTSGTNVNTGAQLSVQIHAEWDAHP
jgi:hypothetical protein